MKDKQLTLKEVIKEIGDGRCLSCRKKMYPSTAYNLRIPLCRKCRIEVMEDL